MRLASLAGTLVILLSGAALAAQGEFPRGDQGTP